MATGGPEGETEAPLTRALYSFTRNIANCGWASFDIVKIVLVCVLYIASSIFLSLYNKWLLHPKYHGFSFPVLLITIHSLTNFILSGFAMILCLKKTVTKSDHWVTRIGKREYLLYLAPIGIFFALDVVLTQISYMYISVALSEIVKSTIPMIVMVIGYFLGREDIDFLRFSTLAVIMIGVVLTVLSEMDYDRRGFIAAVFATIAAVAKLIWMETVVGKKKRVPSMLALFYFSPVSFVFLGISFFPTEFKKAEDSPFLNGPERFNTLGYIMLGAAVAFMLNVSELLVVQNTGALTLCIIGILKFILIIPISVTVYNHQLNSTNIIGIFVTALGVAMYQYIKYRQHLKDQYRFERLKRKRAGSDLPAIPEEGESDITDSDEYDEDSSRGKAGVEVELGQHRPTRRLRSSSDEPSGPDYNPRRRGSAESDPSPTRRSSDESYRAPDPKTPELGGTERRHDRGDSSPMEKDLESKPRSWGDLEKPFIANSNK